MRSAEFFRAGPAGCLVAAASLLLAGCDLAPARSAGPPPAQPQAVAPQVPDWQQTAVSADVERLGRIDQAWSEALAAARKGGFGRSLAAERTLLDPGAALARPAPGPGSYMCKLIQIGATARGAKAFAASKPGFCYVGADEDGRLWLAKQTGAQRREGYLLDDVNARRMIYLGTLARGARDTAPSYGTVPDRSRGAVLERIGPLRYRLVTPWPPGFKLEVMELTPAPLQSDD